MATPESVSGDGATYEPYGARSGADDTRQAQQQVANDAPVDVNPNAILAREQGATLVLMGKNFEAGASRRNALFDHLAYVSGAQIPGKA